jgi:hypothetical protein
LGINAPLAGLSGRSAFLGINATMATAFDGRGEPGTLKLGISAALAGLDGRTRGLGIRLSMATVFVLIFMPYPSVRA